MNIIKHVIDAAKGKHPLKTRRSSEWPKARASHLKKYPACSVCGGTTKVEVHHIKPFHLHPELELDPANFITLCESKRFFNCHRIFGHCNNFRLVNPQVVSDATEWCAKLISAYARFKQRNQA